MFCIQWDTMPLAYLPNNMLLNMVYILSSVLNRTSQISGSSSIILDFALIGIVKYERVIPLIINGRSGFFCNFLKVFITGNRGWPSRLPTWFLPLNRKEIANTHLPAILPFHFLPVNGLPSMKKKNRRSLWITAWLIAVMER